jgi:putative MATE family efflux protein
MRHEQALRAESVEPRPLEAAPEAYRRIWKLAWPVSISTSTITLLTLANLFWIGHLGTVAVAAVSICGQILFIVFGVSNIVHTGALAIVSRRVGEGDRARAFTASLHGVCLGALLGLIVGIVGYISAPTVLGFFGTGGDVERLALSYLRIMYVGQLPLFVSVALAATYQASGDTRTPMLVNIAVVTVNGVADPFFIFGPGEVTIAGIPLGWLGWGVDGGAIAAALSGAAGCALFVGFSALRGRPFPWPSDGRVTLGLDQFTHMARIGAPASVSMIARPLSTFLLLRVIASFGTPAIAAFGIAMRSFNVNWIPYSGLMIAISSLVGQSLGRRDVGEARAVVRRGLWITTFLGMFFCVLYFAFAENIVRAFDHEPAVVHAGASFLQLIALSFLFSGPMLPLGAAMNGAGDTKPPMIVAFLANWLVKLPLCYALALPLGYGIDGVWLGMFVSIVFEAMVMFAWYRRGTWLAKKL